MNGGLKRKQPEEVQKAADALEPGATPEGDSKQPPEHQAGQQQQAGEQREQPKRQKQQDGAMETEGAKQGVDSQGQTQADAQQGSGLVAQAQLQEKACAGGPASQQEEQQQRPRQQQAEDRREVATRRAAQPLPAARQHRWPVPPPRLKQQGWRPAQVRMQCRVVAPKMQPPWGREGAVEAASKLYGLCQALPSLAALL